MNGRRIVRPRTLELVLLVIAVAVVTAKISRVRATPTTADSLWIDSAFADLPVAPIAFIDEAANLEQAFADDTTRLVLIYSKHCSACIQVRPVWEELAGKLSNSVDVLAFGVEPGDTSQFLNASRIRTPRIASLAQLRRSFPWRGVPTTVVVSGEGQIVLWVEGAFSRAASDRVLETANSER